MPISNCEGCPYKGSRLVPGEGPTTASIVIIGEAPGEEEEKSGRPFVGSSGRAQDGIMYRAGVDRQRECYVTNVLKCRPPKNDIKTPEAQRAIALCTPKLYDELGRLRSKQVIVPTGNVPLHALGFEGAIGEMRGFIHICSWGKVIPTYHPASLWRQPEEYDTSVRDWKRIRRHSLGGGGVGSYTERFTLFPSVLDIEAFRSSVDQASQKSTVEVAVDVETYYGRQSEVPLKLVGFATSSSDAITIPLIKESGNIAWASHDDELRVIQAIGGVLENPRVMKIFQNGVFDISVLMNHGFTVTGPVFDTILAHYLIYEPAKHDLGFIVSCYADYQPWKTHKGIGDDLNFRKYNARDCAVLHMIKPGLEAEAKALGLGWLLDTLNNAVIPTARMGLNGIHFDLSKKKEVENALLEHLDELKLQIENLGGSPDINLKSSQQVAEMLFKKLGMKSQVHTGKGALSTDEDVLKRLCIRYPDSKVPPLILDYRKAEKLRSTYIDPPVGLDGRVHSSFSLKGTVTGRFSSSEPNLQNLPSMSKDRTTVIRKLYSAEAGNLVIESDASQIELRIFAILAQDPSWLDAFAKGEDIHKLNALDILGFYEEPIRRFIKEFIYGIVYGSDGSEIERVAPLEVLKKISVKQAVANLWTKHPSLLYYKNQAEKEVMGQRRVISPFGRIRWFVNKPTQENVREGANFKIQATVSDTMHYKFAILDRELDWPTDRIILQLHDAFYIETSEKRVDVVGRIMKEVMEEEIQAPNGMRFRFPIEQKVGPSLGDMRKYG